MAWLLATVGHHGSMSSEGTVLALWRTECPKSSNLVFAYAVFLWGMCAPLEEARHAQAIVPAGRGAAKVGGAAMLAWSGNVRWIHLNGRGWWVLREVRIRFMPWRQLQVARGVEILASFWKLPKNEVSSSPCSRSDWRDATRLMLEASSLQMQVLPLLEDLLHSR